MLRLGRARAVFTLYFIGGFLFILWTCSRIDWSLVGPLQQSSGSDYHNDEVVIPNPTLVGDIDSDFEGESTAGLANATFYFLAKNSDIEETVKTMHQLETKFNHHFGYPYVFLNDVPFSDEFKSRVLSATNSSVEFGLIPHDDWNQPPWIDEEKAAKVRESFKAKNIKYGDSVSYRNMCRFNSGFFFRHELLQKYKWYWRVEPGVQFHCNVPFDPFRFMEKNNKVYSFTISAKEIPETINTLWWYTKQFTGQHPEFIAQDNALRFISDNNGGAYTNCHFWSNFEIADMDFWRGPAYTAYFDYLDKAGGFYYERWGDAPIHSIAVSLFSRKDQIHFFDDIGYQHDDWMHCPSKEEAFKANECTCNPHQSFDYQLGSCNSEWDKVFQ